MRSTFSSLVSALAVIESCGAGLVSANAVRARQGSVVTVTQTIVSEPTPEPTNTAYDWAAGWTRTFPIHSSCNATERALLGKGVEDAVKLAQHAKDHILRFGNSSDFYTKYFGSAPGGEVVGWYDMIVNSDKTGAWLRCDDIDKNCHQDGWAGHWRGENATHETVICPLSYTVRRPLEALCGFGWTVAAGETNDYFGSDLIHRALHVPSVGGGIAGHHADTYEDCLALAKEDVKEDGASLAARNSLSLQLFALDVYAYEVALPQEGCTGTVPEKTEEDGPTPTESAGKECHTHADGEEHCV